MPEYDIFITGSDQVWNPIMYNDAYRLDFVPSTKRKISYAASISQYTLSEEERNVFKNTLNSYHSISVRENHSVDLLKDLTEKSINYVLDPVLLLDKNDWDIIATSRLIKEPYIFCYFLGNDKNIISLAREYALKKNLRLVAIAYLGGNGLFADFNLSGVSPADFISLIKYADCVFTDSFHATVFSNIYEREFFVFCRSEDEYKGMATRIESLTNLFHQGERFIKNVTDSTLKHLLELDKIDYKIDNDELKEIKEKSLRFLKQAIE